MAKLVGRIRDRNRFTKKYSFVRAPKKLVLETEGTLEIELLTLTFNNQSSQTGTYEIPFEDTGFRVLISPRDTSSTDSANVSLSVDDNLSDQYQVTVNASAPFTGVVDVVTLRVIA